MQNLCKNIMAVFLKMNDHNITQYTTHKMMAILKMMTNAEYNYYYTECAFPPGTIQHVPLPNLLLEGSVALLQRQAGSQRIRVVILSLFLSSPSFSGKQVVIGIILSIVIFVAGTSIIVISIIISNIVSIVSHDRDHCDHN